MSIVKLENIVATGAQYIDTGFVPDGNTEISLEWELTPEYISTNNSCAWCARSSALAACPDSNTFFFIKPSTYRLDNYGVSTNIAPSSLSGPIKITRMKTSCIVGNEEITFQAVSTESPMNLYLFASTTSGNKTSLANYAYAKIYWVKIWDNGTLIRNYIPVTQNGVAGLYDTVNEVFYGSKSSTAFVAGPNKKIKAGSVRVKVNGSWKDAIQMYVKVDGVWKTVTSVQPIIRGAVDILVLDDDGTVIPNVTITLAPTGPTLGAVDIIVKDENNNILSGAIVSLQKV